MTRKTDIFLYFRDKMRQLFGVIVLIATFCFTNLSMYAQRAEIVATYDEESGVLEIKTQKRAIALPLSQTMPRSMQETIKDAQESTGDLYSIAPEKVATFEVGKEEMEGYKTIYYISPDDKGDFSIHESVPIRFREKKETMSDSQQSNKYLPFIIAGVLLLMIFMAWLIYYRKKKIKHEEERNAYSHAMQVVEEEKNSGLVGLNHVYQNPDNYFALDMHFFFDDTAVENVYMSRDIIKRINSYFKTYLDNPERTPETGCYLIGVWERIAGANERYNVSIEEMVTPGDDMIPGEFSLNFGLKIGINLGSTIRNLCEKTNRDYVQTAWMHSHPGLGLFLSSHDLTVQQQLTYPDEPKRLLAIVIDTNTPDWQTVFFSAKNDGTMNNKENLRQVISFDTLLEWSRHKTVSASSFETAIKSTFNVISTDSADMFAFTSKALNQMDDVMDSATSNKVYGFHAEIQQMEGRKIRLVSECESTDPNWNNCFITKMSGDFGTLDISQRAGLFNSCDFGLVFDEARQCFILYRNAQQEIRTLPISLKEMKEWTRRKRV